MPTSDQFTVPNFTRGVKLTLQHVFTPLSDLEAAAAAADVRQTEDRLGATRLSFVVPKITAEAAQAWQTDYRPTVLLPFTLPPFQELFDRSTMEPPDYTLTLDEISLSLDQRAEPNALDGVLNGFPSDPATRYTTVIRLLERKPTLLGGNDSDVAELLALELDGNATYGGQLRANPMVLGPLNLPVKPFAVYVWEISFPQLYAVAAATEIASWHLSCKVLSPLTDRDVSGSPIDVQNIPSLYGSGAKNGTALPFTTPAADAAITGTDIQSAQGVFDQALRQRLESGYGLGHGALQSLQAAAPPPHETLANDAHYQVIAVPMFNGGRYDTVRGARVATAGLPYAVAPYTDPAFDGAVMRLPDNFVLHHAFAVWNNWSPPCTAAAGEGTRASDAAYVQAIGIGLSTGYRGDNYFQQQMAYLYFDGTSYGPWQVDQYDPFVNGVQVPGYNLLQIPLVSPDAWNGNSWLESGRPFFMGQSQQVGSFRTVCGSMPFSFGGGVTHTPVTEGQETMLEVRWSKQRDDAGNGLDLPATDIRTGVGGDWVILVGKQTLGA